MKVWFVAGFGPIVQDMESSRRLYGEALGLPLEGDATYLHTGAVEGVKHFALWPLSGAAESCFGTATWPSEVPTPSAWMEFDVEDIDEATRELEERGYPAPGGRASGAVGAVRDPLPQSGRDTRRDHHHTVDA